MLPSDRTVSPARIGQPLSMDTRWDWGWSDGFIPEVRRILIQCALHLFKFTIATAHQDLKQATDFMVTIAAVHDIGIAVRLRRPRYDYRDLTIRAARVSGVPTELDKLRDGKADFYLYGWTEGWAIREWMLIDLDKLRASGLLDRPWKLIRNYDHTTAFIAIPYTVLSQYGCVLQSRMGGY